MIDVVYANHNRRAAMQLKNYKISFSSSRVRLFSRDGCCLDRSVARLPHSSARSCAHMLITSLITNTLFSFRVTLLGLWFLWVLHGSYLIFVQLKELKVGMFLLTTILEFIQTCYLDTTFSESFLYPYVYSAFLTTVWARPLLMITLKCF